MKVLNLSRIAIPEAALLKRTAKENDADIEITEPCIVQVDGKTEIIYAQLENVADLSWAVRSINYGQSKRQTGLVSTSRIFGFSPRAPLLGRNACMAASMARAHPGQHEVLCRYGQMLSEMYRAAAPEQFDRQQQELKKILDQWVIPGTVFTSGIVNKNNPLKYHLDRGNFLDVFSCMVVLRKNCEGGYLVVPELNAKFLLSDRSVFLFDGQKWLHGVSQIKMLNDQGYRYSIVYYALRAMCKCGSIEDELDHARGTRMKIERRRVDLKTEDLAKKHSPTSSDEKPTN